ncbi:MAG: hypothetical protein ABUL60_02020 [Myxococcales bacterium]
MKLCTLCLLLCGVSCSSETPAPTASGGSTSGAAGTNGASGSSSSSGSSNGGSPQWTAPTAPLGGGGGGGAGGANTVAGSAGTGGNVAGTGGASGGAAGASTGGAGGAGGAAAGAGPGDAAALQGLTLQVKCGAPANQERSCSYLPPGDANCGSNQVRTYAMASKTMGGTPGSIYDVTLRIRGIVEANVYTGGTSDMNGFYVGGKVGGNEGGAQYSQYSLEISAPASVNHLNQLDPGAQQDMYKNPTNGGLVHHFGFKIDYRETIKIEGGATVTLKGQDNDCYMGRNCKPPANDFGHCELQKLDGLTEEQVPQGAGFDGNFIWIDVEQAILSK